MKTKILQVSVKSSRLLLYFFRSRWYLAGLLLLTLAGGSWWLQSNVLAAAGDPVRDAWEAARALGVYHFTSDLTQVTTPLATLSNVGSSSRQTALHLEGATDLPASTINLRLWTQDGSVSQPSSGVEVRMIHGKTQMRQIDDSDPSKGWQE